MAEVLSRKKKALAFAELRSMVADGKIEEAVGLLRTTHEQEMIEMRARQTREFSREMVSLPAGADTAEAEAQLSVKQKTELAALETQQEQEVVALQEGSKLPFDEPEDTVRKAEEEKAKRAEQIMLHAQQVKAQMDEELQRMEAQILKRTSIECFCCKSSRALTCENFWQEELEEQLRKEREEYDLKRLELSTRAAERRQQMGQDALDMSPERLNTPSRRGQTAEEIFEEHKQNKRLHAMAVSQQERAQREELEKRLLARKRKKSKEFVAKFKQDVLENGMPASCSDLRGMDLSAEERAQVCGARLRPLSFPSAIFNIPLSFVSAGITGTILIFSLRRSARRFMERDCALCHFCTLPYPCFLCSLVFCFVFA